jgi:hypothetical protein
MKLSTYESNNAILKTIAFLQKNVIVKNKGSQPGADCLKH